MALGSHTTSRPLKWPRKAAVTKNKETEGPRIATAWEEGVNYCHDKARFLHMQSDYDAEGACKLVPAVALEHTPAKRTQDTSMQINHLLMLTASLRALFQVKAFTVPKVFHS